MVFFTIWFNYVRPITLILEPCLTWVWGWRGGRSTWWPPASRRRGARRAGHTAIRLRDQKTVFRIHDNLVWIWIRESMPLIDGSGSRCGCGCGSCYFRHKPSRGQQKTNFFYTIVLLITFLRYIYIIFRRWKVQKKSQTVGTKVFPTILLDDRRIRIRIHSSD